MNSIRLSNVIGIERAGDNSGVTSPVIVQLDEVSTVQS